MVANEINQTGYCINKLKNPINELLATILRIYESEGLLYNCLSGNKKSAYVGGDLSEFSLFMYYLINSFLANRGHLITLEIKHKYFGICFLTLKSIV